MLFQIDGGSALPTRQELLERNPENDSPAGEKKATTLYSKKEQLN
jgi:hypothetical protein